MGKKIGALLVDNSKIAGQILRKILQSDNEIELLAQANNADEAISLVAKLKPDVVLIDINMPKGDSLSATRKIMGFYPTPIIILTNSNTELTMKRSFEALASGATEVLEKPINVDADNSNFLKAVKLVSKIKVITHLAGKHDNTMTKSQEAVVNNYAIFVAASTGGPNALKQLLNNIDLSLDAGIIIAQHIAKGFMPGLISWLARECKLEIKEAHDGDKIERGTVLFCPADAHAKITSNRLVKIINGPAVNGIKPAADILFTSAAQVYGPKAIGIVLTGMGGDGAKGLLKIREHGGITMAQDEKSCVVYGMPKKAISLKAVDKIMCPEDMARYIMRVIGDKHE